MLGPSKPRDLDRPVIVSLEALVPRNHFYRHLERTLDLAFVRDCRDVSPLRGLPVRASGSSSALQRSVCRHAVAGCCRIEPPLRLRQFRAQAGHGDLFRETNRIFQARIAAVLDQVFLAIDRVSPDERIRDGWPEDRGSEWHAFKREVGLQF